MFGLPVIIMIIAILAIFYSKDWNFGEFGMPRNERGFKSVTLYLQQYEYIKDKGETSIFLSLILGSFGVIPLSLFMALCFFILNSVLYMCILIVYIENLGEINFLVAFGSVHIINAIFVYGYVKMRLYILEKKISKHIKEHYNGDDEKSVRIREKKEEKLFALKES